MYKGIYNPEKNNVLINDLIYIGQASDIQQRIGGSSHEHLQDWKGQLKENETLLYSRAFIENKEDRLRAESAMIYYYKPLINDSGKGDFHYPDTRIVTSGKNRLIEDVIILQSID